MVPSVLRHRRVRRVRLAAAAVCALALAIGGATVVYQRLKPAGTCTGEPIRLTVAASVDQFTTVDKLVANFNAGNRTVAGHCVEVKVRPAEPAVVAGQLSAIWDEERDGPRPDVWMPDSSAWLLVASARPDAKVVLPTGVPPSVATSPVVLAMQRPMAEALGWPKQEIGLTDLLDNFGQYADQAGRPAGQGKTWAQFDHPEWGSLRLGMPDPTRSTAGLVSVLTVLDPDNDGAMGDRELVGGLAFSQLVTTTANDTENLLRAYNESDSTRAARTLPAAVPVLERDLALYAAASPHVELVPVYLREGSTFADYPYVVLRAPWVDKDRRALAAEFLAYLRTPDAQRVYSETGFRDPSRSTEDIELLDPNRGFKLEFSGPQRAATEDELNELMGTWTALQRPNNALLALDTSGSMDEHVPGTDQSRLQLVQQAAIQGATVLNEQTTIGLWQFSTWLGEDTDYRELVPPGKAGEKVDGVERRQAIIDAVRRLRAAGGTGLYDTVYAAYLRMQQAWRPNAQNVLVVMTDGKNEDDRGLTLAELIDKLKAADQAERPLPIIGIAVGPKADAQALRQISNATKGRTVVARNELAAIRQILLAFAGRIDATASQ